MKYIQETIKVNRKVFCREKNFFNEYHFQY